MGISGGEVRRSRRTHRETRKLNLGHTFVTLLSRQQWQCIKGHKPSHHYTTNSSACAYTQFIPTIQAHGQTLHSFLRPLDLLSFSPFPIKIREALMAPTGSLARPTSIWLKILDIAAYRLRSPRYGYCTCFYKSVYETSSFDN